MGREKAVDGAKKKPDADCKAKKTCLDERRVRITPKQVSYVVVLNKTGALFAAYPILDFDITDGPPGYAVDVQISRDVPGLLTGGPGLKNTWDKSKQPVDRIKQQAFSSYTNGDTGLVLDRSGKASYKMPLDWWRDQARRARKNFTTAKIYYRALGSPSAGAAPTVWSTKDGDTAPNVPIHNNLVNARVIENPINNGYTGTGENKQVDMEFTVREANTTEMYTIVQWKKGTNEVWPRTTPGTPRYATVRDYGLIHRFNNPNWTIDRLDTNPRYRNGVFTISTDKRTATTDDTPGGPIGATDTHDFFTLDFDTRIHLNFEVPAAVTVVKKDGSPPIYALVEGKIAPPEPFIIDQMSWDTRILQVRSGGTVTVTHPNTYGGP